MLDQVGAADLALVGDRARAYADQAKAANTIRAYRSDWRHFTAWCDERSLASMPATPETVALYLTDLAGTGFKASTLQRRLSAISQAHQYAGQPTPTKDAAVRAVWAGIRRAHGTAQEGKAPALVDELRAMIATLPIGLKGTRDRALLLLGFAGALRRSELVALDAADVVFVRDGLIVTLRRSKTDQDGQGRQIGIPAGVHPATDPVRAVKTWLRAADIVAGPLFRAVNRHGQLQRGRLSDKAVASVVKATAAAAGLDPTR